jgi:hypothetical protein
MEYWAARSGDKEAVVEFSVTDLGFQGRFSAGLGAKLSFCLHSISPFHNSTGEIYHINIEPYPKCDYPDFAKVESRQVKTYTPCKHMYWVLLEHLGWKETDMLIHQPTWSQNDISKIVKGRRPVQGI